jgi:serine/threonine protein kinase
MVKMFLVETGGWSLEGYTKAVDWWSLGVTMYKLLLSDYPFKVNRRELDVDDPVLQQEQLWHRYAVLLEEVDYRELSSDPDLVDLLSSLLCVEESRRLGYGHTGSADIGFHPYFKTINWMDLEQKNLPPPPLPSCIAETVNLDSKPPTAQYLSLSHLLTKIGFGYWLKFGAGPGSKEADSAKLAPQEIEWLQEPFENWDYISPAAVVAEQIAARAGAHV